MKKNTNKMGMFAYILGIVPEYFHTCSKGTQSNLKQLGKALAFTVLVCGIILGASFCEFWLNRNYLFLPAVFLGTGLFYYLLDRAIVVGDAGKYHSAYKKARIFIALALGLFNSFLIDYYFFKSDIVAAREVMVNTQSKASDKKFQTQIRLQDAEKTKYFAEIDIMEKRLVRDLDSLNAEADGTGGSHHKGVSTFWKAKYQAYQADSIRISENIKTKRAEIGSINLTINGLNDELTAEKAKIPSSISKGINMSLQLLHQVIWEQGSFTNMLMSVLILIVSMLLELIPLITKGFYDISEYFGVIERDKDATTTGNNTRMQNKLSLDSGKLMSEMALETTADISEHKLAVMQESFNYSKNVMYKTEAFMDELAEKQQQWQAKYPDLYERYGKPVIDKSYLTLSTAIDKAYV